MPGCDEALGWPAAFGAAQARVHELGAELVPLDFELLFEVAKLLYEGPWVAERLSVVDTLPSPFALAAGSTLNGAAFVPAIGANAGPGVVQTFPIGTILGNGGTATIVVPVTVGTTPASHGQDPHLVLTIST